MWVEVTGTQWEKRDEIEAQSGESLMTIHLVGAIRATNPRANHFGERRAKMRPRLVL